MVNPNNAHAVEKLVVVILLVIAAYIVVNNIVNSLNYSEFGIQYKPYIIDAINSLLIIIGAYIAYRVFVSAIIFSAGSRLDSGSADVIRLTLKILFYIVAVTVILSSSGLNLASALAGGAIGGVIIGLAVQTIATNILSGIFVSTSKAVRVGDVASFRSAAWGENICIVTKIGFLWTQGINQYGNEIRIPNSALLGNILFTTLKYGDEIRYLLPVTLNSDVPAGKIKAKAAMRLSKEFSKKKLNTPSVHIIAINGSTITFSVELKFNKFSDLNSLIDVVNDSFNSAYFDSK